MKKGIKIILITLFAFILFPITKVDARVQIPVTYKKCEITYKRPFPTSSGSASEVLGTGSFTAYVFSLGGGYNYVYLPKTTTSLGGDKEYSIMSNDESIANITYRGNDDIIRVSDYACPGRSEIIGATEIVSSKETTLNIGNVSDSWAVWKAAYHTGNFSMQISNRRVYFYKGTEVSSSEFNISETTLADSLARRVFNYGFTPETFTIDNLSKIYVSEGKGVSLESNAQVIWSWFDDVFEDGHLYVNSDNLESKVNEAMKLEEVKEKLPGNEIDTSIKEDYQAFKRAYDEFRGFMNANSGYRELREIYFAKIREIQSIDSKEERCDRARRELEPILTQIRIFDAAYRKFLLGTKDENGIEKLATLKESQDLAQGYDEYVDTIFQAIFMNSGKIHPDMEKIIKTEIGKIVAYDYYSVIEELSNIDTTILYTADAWAKANEEFLNAANELFEECDVNVSDEVRDMIHEVGESGKNNYASNIAADLIENLLTTDDTYTPTFDANNCEDLIGPELKEVIMEIFNYVKVIVPVLVIVLGMADFGKALMASNEDAMKKAQITFVKRLIMAVAIFFVPLLVDVILSAANEAWSWIAHDNCGIF